MRSLIEQIENNGQHLTAEPLPIGRDMFYVQRRVGKTGKVIYHGVFEPAAAGGWRQVAWVRALTGFRKGQYEASSYWGRYDDGTAVKVEAECQTQQLAIDLMIRLCQSVRP